MKKSLIILPIMLLSILLVYFFLREGSFSEKIRNQAGQSEVSSDPDEIIRPPDAETVAENLEIPWEIAFLPDGKMLATERTGNLRILTPDGDSQAVIRIENVRAAGEGGLLGLAIHPSFSENNFIYFYLTTTNQERLINRIERYELKDNKLNDKKILLNLPASQNHNGGRIKFGPDGKLYIATGDAGNSQSSQELSSLAGKILRINDDGSIPSDNPLSNSPVYAYGLRNPQGLAWDSAGNLWATDHGRSGIASGYDELNRIEKGKNYGWPEIQGPETRENMETPIINSGPADTWAPAGAIFKDGRIFFTGLRGESLYGYDIETRELKSYFSGTYGRLRAIGIDPNGMLYIGTSNLDGRGVISSGDDKIIRINPDILQ